MFLNYFILDILKIKNPNIKVLTGIRYELILWKSMILLQILGL